MSFCLILNDALTSFFLEKLYVKDNYVWYDDDFLLLQIYIYIYIVKLIQHIVYYK
jgi:hypothetical protein